MDAAERPQLRLVRKTPPVRFRFPSPNISAIVALWVMVLAGMTLAANDPPTTPGELYGFIRDVGFPIAVAAFVLVRMEPALRELTRVVTRLETLLEERRRD